MASTNIKVSYRPLRIGFLIPNGNLRRLVDAISINSLLWGGMYNPLIPVADNKDSAPELMEAFNVDLPFPVDASIDMKQILPAYSQLGHSLKLSRLDLLSDRWQIDGANRDTLDILNIIDHLWGTRAHAWPAERKGPCANVTWDEDDANAALLSVAFGRFPKKDSIFERRFIQDLHSAEIAIGAEDEIPTSLADNRSLIQLTTYGLSARSPYNHPESLFVGSSDSFEDLVSFWNLRAAGVPLLFCDADHLSRWRSFVQGGLAQRKHGPTVTDDRPRAISVYYRSLNEVAVKAVKDSLRLDLNFAPHDLKDERRGMPPVGIATQPTIWHLQEKTVLANVEKQNDTYHVAFELPHLSFLQPNDPRAYCQQFVAVFSPFTEYAYPGHTIRVPSLKGLTEGFGRSMLLAPFDSVIEEEAIGRIVDHFHSSVDIWPLSYGLFSERVLGCCHLSAKPSHAGIIAKALLEQIGGLEAARVLQIRGVRRLMKSLRADQPLEEQEGKKRVHDEGSLRRFRHVYRPGGGGEPFEAQHAFDYLIEKGLLRAGLEFRCNKCCLANWLPLARLADVWVCEYCGESQQAAQLLSGPSGRWKYRKSGLLGKDNNQEGAIPVLLTLLQFSRLFDRSGFVFSPALRLKGPGNIDCEVDLCIFQYLQHEQASWHHQSKLEIGFAECKDEGGQIDDQDIRNMAALYRHINSERIRCYLIFSRTTDAFTCEELDRFRTLKKQRIPVVLLTNSELEAFHPFERAKDTNPRALIVNTLEEMSWMSDSLYLSDAPSESSRSS